MTLHPVALRRFQEHPDYREYPMKDPWDHKEAETHKPHNLVLTHEDRGDTVLFTGTFTMEDGTERTHTETFDVSAPCNCQS